MTTSIFGRAAAGLTMFMAASASVHAWTATISESFKNPYYKGYRLDYCLRWGRDCGQPAATAYCKNKGFEHATSYKAALRIGAKHPTKVFDGGQICSGAGCGGFAEITCAGSMKGFVARNELLSEELKSISADNKRLKELIAQSRTYIPQAESLYKDLSKLRERLTSRLTVYASLLQDVQRVTEQHNAWMDDMNALHEADAKKWRDVNTLPLVDGIEQEVTASLSLVQDDRWLTIEERTLSGRLGYIGSGFYGGNSKLTEKITKILKSGRIIAVFNRPSTSVNIAGVVQSAQWLLRTTVTLNNIRSALEDLDEELLRHKQQLARYVAWREQRRELYETSIDTAAAPLLVKSDINETAAEVVALLDEYASPRLAFREVQVLGVLLDEVDDNVDARVQEIVARNPQNPYGPELWAYYAQVSDFYADTAYGREVYEVYEKKLSDILQNGDVDEYAVARAEYADEALAQQPGDGCVQFWERLIQPQATVEHELALMEALETCAHN